MRDLIAALVIRYARRNALRSSVTILAVALGVALVFAIDLANATAVGSFASSVNIIANQVNLQVYGTGRGFNERALLRVQRVEGVQFAYPATEDELVVGERAGDPESGEVLRVIGMDVTRPLPQVAPGEGAFDLDGFINHRGIIISARIARTYHVRAGGVLRAYAGTHLVGFRVATVLGSSTPGVDSSAAFVDIATAQEVFGKVGMLDRIDCIVDPARLAAVRARIIAVVPQGTRVIEPRVRTDEIRKLLRSFALNLAALSYVALLVGMYLIYNAVAVSVVQRRSEIATARALGASARQIFEVFVFEGLGFGVIGSLCGLALGALLAQGAVGAVSHTVATLYIGSHADRVTFTPVAGAKALSLGVLAALLSALWPAREAAAVAPAIAMRSAGFKRGGIGGSARSFAAGVVLLAIAFVFSRAPAIDGVPLFGFCSGVLIIAGTSLCVPACINGAIRLVHALVGSRAPVSTLALSQMRAARTRFAVAIASLAVAVGMMTSIAVLVGSFRSTIVAWTGQTLRADLFLKPPGVVDASFNGGFTPQFVRRIARLPNIAAVDTFRGFAIPFRDRITYLGAADFRSFLQRNKVQFTSPINVQSVAKTFPDSNNVIISEPFVTRFDLHPGDAFTVSTPQGPLRLHVAATYSDYSSDAGTFIMDAGTYTRAFHDMTADSIAVYVRPRASIPEVRSSILRAIAPARVDIESSRELRAVVLQIFDRTFAITSALYVISIVIAILGVVSTLFALVIERRRDFAVLRYLGLTTGGVRRVVFTQAGVVGALAGVLGVALGIALALLLIFVINRQSFGWLIELHMPFGFFAQAIALVIVAAFAAAIFPSGIAARVRTAEALRDE